MSDYEADSFEAETTGSDEMSDSVDEDPVNPSSSASGSSSSGSRSSRPPDRPAAPAPVASPLTVAPGLGPVPLPVPVPVAVPLQKPAVDAATSSGSDGGSASSPPLPVPRSRGGAFPLAHPVEGLDADRDPSASGRSDGEGWPQASTRRLTDLSTSGSVGLPREVAEAAAHAEDGAGYQLLSNFVAFGSGRASSATGSPSRAPASQRASELQVPPAPSRAPRQFVAFPESARESAAGDGATSASEASQPPLPPAVESPQKAPSDAKSASVAPSSVFSTLSQHVPTPAAVAPPPLPLPSAPPAVVETRGPSQAASPNAGVTPVVAPAVSLTLPSLPLPAWATKPPLPEALQSAVTAAAVPAAAVPPPLPVVESAPLRGGWPGSDATAPRSEAAAVAPLPPPPESARAPAEVERASELREASEAVERLVRAFATLRGLGSYARHNELQQTGAAAGGAAPAAVSAATSTAHRPGAGPTVQVRSTAQARGPRVPTAASSAAAPPAAAQTPSRSGTGAAAVGRHRDVDGERLAEDLVMDCVLGLLQQHTKTTAQGSQQESDPLSPTASWTAARPHYEVVSADAFSSGGGVPLRRPASAMPAAAASRAYASGGAALGEVPGIDVPLFDPRDRHSATDLYNAVREALDKYVLRRVRPAASAAPAATTPATTPLPVTHSSAVFAWALLLDMASVCQEIARCAFDAAAQTPSAVYPILVHYKGEAACGEVVRSAMHCLPFEVLYTAEDGAALLPAERGCLFRMACWVTQEHLWTVSDALADTVREDMVRRATATQYAPLDVAAAAAAEVDVRLLVPPRVPMLAMRPLPTRVGKAMAASAPLPSESTGWRHPRGVERSQAASAEARDLFDVPPAALQTVAYHISSLSTSVLANAGLDGLHTDVSVDGYGDVTLAVSETLGELLQDESIKAAVQRRAAEKVKKAQQEKGGYASATRQRREQAVIDKAEREAEEVVQRILQEMRAQAVRS